MATQYESKKLKVALYLGFITIFYNIAEGIIATVYGASDETLALFGFGVDSFVEVISGIGIVHMIFRMKKHPVEKRDDFEVTALRVTGASFYLLVLGIIGGSIYSIIHRINPETTLVGIIISTISIGTMYVLYRAKLNVGKALNSEPIISDAHCTKSCFYLSFVLLGSSLIYELFAIPYIDVIGSLGIAWFAFKEGKEAFEKAKSKKLSCGDCC